MVRWTSHTRSVELPKEKVQINLNYTSPDSDVEETFIKALTDFKTWNGKPVSLWLCSDEESWEDAHLRNSTIPEEASSFLKSRAEMRTLYTSPEVSMMIGETSDRSLKPNIIVSLGGLAKIDKEKVKPMFEHELSHVEEIDSNYFTPIFKTNFDFLLSHIYSPMKDYYALLYNKFLNNFCSEISANEIFIDHKLTKDFMTYALHISGGLREETSSTEMDTYTPADWLPKILHTTTYIVPLEHKNEKTYAGKMRTLVDGYLKKVKVVDAVGMRNEMENIMDRLRNPIQAADVESVYENVTRKFETLMRGY